MKVRRRPTPVVDFGWVVLSAIFLYFSWSKASRLRDAGHAVTPWQCVTVVFWVVMIVFWAWNWWRDEKRIRAERKVV
jgi:hypothetical protein